MILLQGNKNSLNQGIGEIYNLNGNNGKSYAANVNASSISLKTHVGKIGAEFQFFVKQEYNTLNEA